MRPSSNKQNDILFAPLLKCVRGGPNPSFSLRRQNRYHLNKPTFLAISRTLLIPQIRPFARTLVFYRAFDSPGRDFGVLFRPSAPRTSRKHAAPDLAGASDRPQNPIFVDPPPYEFCSHVAPGPLQGAVFSRKIFRGPCPAARSGLPPGIPLQFRPDPRGRRLLWCNFAPIRGVGAFSGLFSLG